MATVQSAQLPLPYGGRGRVINVDIDPQALTAYGLSPSDVEAFNDIPIKTACMKAKR